jgi:galactonate dehydratase
MAEAFQVPVAPHDCTGPVLLTASVHHSLEIVRAFYYGCYQDLVTDLPPIEDGHIRAPDGPGLGLVLQPDVLKRADCQVMRTAL